MIAQKRWREGGGVTNHPILLKKDIITQKIFSEGIFSSQEKMLAKTLPSLASNVRKMLNSKFKNGGKNSKLKKENQNMLAITSQSKTNTPLQQHINLSHGY